MQPKPGAPVVARALAGDLADARRRRRAAGCFLEWEERRRRRRATSRCVDPAHAAATALLRGGLTAFFFQYLLQAGLFFAVPLFLSVALGLSAIATGVRLLPLSITLLLAAVGDPEVLPRRVAAPGRARSASLALFAGIVVAGRRARRRRRARDRHLADAARRARASARWRRSSAPSPCRRCPTSRAARSAGCRTPSTNLGASIGTALAGAVLISALTASFFTGIADNPDVPDEVVVAGAGRARQRRARSSPTRTSRPRSTTPGVTADDRRRDRRRERGGPARRPAGGPGGPGPDGARRAVLHPTAAHGADTPQPRRRST